MAQTRFGSVTEAVANTAIGWSVNFAANLLLLPVLYDPNRLVHSAFLIGCVFTVISLIRSYILRRVFDGLRFGNTANSGMERAQ